MGCYIKTLTLSVKRREVPLAPLDNRNRGGKTGRAETGMSKQTVGVQRTVLLAASPHRASLAGLEECRSQRSVLHDMYPMNLPPIVLLAERG